ncbi:MAG: translocation/assembly module TamB domain-containing protein [Pseudomonadota bacterium]
MISFRNMCRAFVCAFALGFPASLWGSYAYAQSSLAERLLENQLSSEGRIVEIDGFTGALSSQARMERLQISDATGVWLTLENVALDWTQSALLRGRLEVRELSAERLEISRRPMSDPSPPSAEASGFGIPDLPISIDVQSFALQEVSVGEDILGTAFKARVTSSAMLAEERLKLLLKAERIDEVSGEVSVTLDFDGEAQILQLDLTVNEPEGGLVARALDLPGTPSLSLDADGAGPLDALDIDIRLATENEERLTGRVSLIGDETGRQFAADLAGDIRPLLHGESQEFFGSQTTLSVAGRRAQSGVFDLSALDLRTQSLSLTGSARVDADRMPGAFELDLLIVNENGFSPVRLPGTTVDVTKAQLNLEFDRTQSQAVSLAAEIDQVVTEGIVINALKLMSNGVLSPSADTALTAQLSLEALGLNAPNEAGITSAFGGDTRLTSNLTAQSFSEFSLQDFRLSGPNGTATGEFEIAPREDQLISTATLETDIPELAPFAELAGIALDGALDATLDVSAEVPGGSLAVSLSGTSQDLDIGAPQLTPVLSPPTELALQFSRDENGSRIEAFDLSNSELNATAQGQINSGDGALEVSVNLREAGIFDERLQGPVAIKAALSDIQGIQNVAAQITSRFGLAVDVNGDLAGPNAAVNLIGTFAEIERFAAPLNGEMAIDASLALSGEHPVAEARLMSEPGITALVSGPVSGPDAEIDVRLSMTNLGAFVPQLAGPSIVEGSFNLAGQGLPFEVTATTEPGLLANLAGTLTSEMPSVELQASINDLAEFVAALPGPAELTATVDDFIVAPDISARLKASRGVEAEATGRPLGEAGALSIQAKLDNAGVFVPQLPGPAELNLEISQPTGRLGMDANLEATGLTATATGALAEPEDRVSIEVNLARLAAFAPDLAGGARLSGDVSALRTTPVLNLTLRTDSGASARLLGPVAAGGPGTNLSVQGDLPLALAAPFVGDRSISGDVRFDLALRDALSLAALSGQVQMTDARLFDPIVNVTLEDLSATVSLSTARAQINARGTANRGSMNATGTVSLQSQYPTDIDLRIDQFAYAFEDVLTTKANIALALTGSATSRLAVTGGIDLFETEIRVPDTGLGGATAIPKIRHVGGSTAARQTRLRAGVEERGPKRSGTTQSSVTVPLDIAVRARDPIFVRGRGLDAEFSGGVTVQGTAQNPEPVGRFTLERGRLDFLGRRLDLTEGVIVASGAEVPNISVTAETQAEELTATITVSGPANAPELELSSSPDRPEDEILAQVLFGRSIDTLSPFQIARLVASVRTLTSGGTSFLERTRQGLNIDNLDVTTTETGATEVTIGQNITENIYSDVEIDSDSNTQINLNFDLNKNTKIRGSVSNSGETGAGVFWQKDY